MARFASDAVLDTGLDDMKTAVDAVGGEMTICQGYPEDFEQADSELGTGTGKVLARVINPTLTIDDDTSGRKCTISEKLAATILQSGDADHIALTDGDSVLWFVTTCTEQALVAAGTVDVPAWKINIQDPTAPA